MNYQKQFQKKKKTRQFEDLPKWLQKRILAKAAESQAIILTYTNRIYKKWITIYNDGRAVKKSKLMPPPFCHGGSWAEKKHNEWWAARYRKRQIVEKNKTEAGVNATPSLF